MEKLQDCESITGHQEEEVQNVSSPGLLGSGSSLLVRGSNMEDEDYSYQEDHLELQDGKNTTGYRENEVQNVPSPSPLDKELSLLGRGPNTESGDHTYPGDHPRIGQRHDPAI